MLGLDPAWLQLAIGLISTGLTAGFFIYIVRQQNALISKFTPIVSNVFKNMGAKGLDSQEIAKVEGMVAEDMQEGLLNVFPEFELILSWLSPDTLEALKENPATLPILFQRYGPMIPGLLKAIPGLGEKLGQGQAQYDV